VHLQPNTIRVTISMSVGKGGWGIWQLRDWFWSQPDGQSAHRLWPESASAGYGPATRSEDSFLTNLATISFRTAHQYRLWTLGIMSAPQFNSQPINYSPIMPVIRP